MSNLKATLKYKIQNVNASTFDDVANELFSYQVRHNTTYRDYINHLNQKSKKGIVFLPISAFKNHEIKSGSWDSQVVFSSSNTGGEGRSQHHVSDINNYLASCHNSWRQFYGKSNNVRFLCLLPGYLEREGSSLIYMMQDFVQKSQYDSGFFLHDHEALYEALKESKEKKIKTVLFGVSYALLDFVESFKINFPELIVMETGGMKGTRREMLKDEFHAILKNGFDVMTIHSEYGMTELFSQAYSSGDGLFYPPKQMKVITTQITDPLSLAPYGKTGILNIIDLNNIDSCCFIQTEDLGICYEDGSFRLMGRLDQADIRGCNLMVI